MTATLWQYKRQVFRLLGGGWALAAILCQYLIVCQYLDIGTGHALNCAIWQILAQCFLWSQRSKCNNICYYTWSLPTGFDPTVSTTQPISPGGVSDPVIISLAVVGVVGLVAAVGILAIVCCFCVRRSRQNKEERFNIRWGSYDGMSY